MTRHTEASNGGAWGRVPGVVLWIVVVLFPAGVGWGSPTALASAQTSDEFRLEAVRTTPVPAGFEINGATVLPDGSVVGWGPSGAFTVDVAGNLEQPSLPIGLQPRGLRVLEGRVPSFEVLGLEGELVTPGEMAESNSLHLPGNGPEIVQSAFARDGWFVLLRQENEAQPEPDRLWLLPDRSGQHQKARSEWIDIAPEWEHSVHLSATGGDVLATEIGLPFRTWRIGAHPQGRPEGIRVELLHEEGLVTEQLTEFGFLEEQTVALRAVRSDRGYLLQVSELIGDRRLILLLDEKGALIRSSTIDAALGFMASEPRSRLLLAFRDIGRQDLVLYRWEWRERE